MVIIWFDVHAIILAWISWGWIFNCELVIVILNAWMFGQNQTTTQIITDCSNFVHFHPHGNQPQWMGRNLYDYHSFQQKIPWSNNYAHHFTLEKHWNYLYFLRIVPQWVISIFKHLISLVNLTRCESVKGLRCSAMSRISRTSHMKSMTGWAEKIGEIKLQ